MSSNLNELFSETLPFESLETTELEGRLKKALHRAWDKIPEGVELKVKVTISENSITIDLPRVITFFAIPRPKPAITLYECGEVSRNILSIASSNNTWPMVSMVNFSSRYP